MSVEQVFPGVIVFKPCTNDSMNKPDDIDQLIEEMERKLKECEVQQK